MKVLLVDDESLALKTLVLLIEQYIPEISTCFTAPNAKSALHLLGNEAPELLFLDVEMPVTGGFDLLDSLGEDRPPVIFTTAHNEYAVRAIRYAAFDYLLKPVDAVELRKAMDRFLHQKQTFSRIQTQGWPFLKENLKVESSADYHLSVKTVNGMHFLKLNSIIRFEAERSYSYLHLSGRKNLLASQPLSYFEELLPANDFLRVHKSHLVNKRFIHQVEGDFLVLEDDSRVPVARRRKGEVMEELMKN